MINNINVMHFFHLQILKNLKKILQYNNNLILLQIMIKKQMKR